MTTYLRNKERLKDNKQTLSDFAKLTPFAVSDLEFIPQNNDLVMDGPFAEPDSYFRAPATTNKHCQMWHQT